MTVFFYQCTVIASEMGGNILSLATQVSWWIVGCLGWVSFKIDGGQPQGNEQQRWKR